MATTANALTVDSTTIRMVVFALFLIISIRWSACFSAIAMIRSAAPGRTCSYLYSDSGVGSGPE